MTQLEMAINTDEKQNSVDHIPGVLVKGLNRKRAKERHPRQLPRVCKKPEMKGNRSITLSLW